MLAFDQAGEIKVTPLSGGPITTLGAGITPHWGTDGYVYAWSARDSAAVRWPANGGPMEPIARGRAADPLLISEILPDNHLALSEIVGPTGARSIHVVDLTNGTTDSLFAGRQPHLAPSGHIVYLANNSLMAAPFDSRRGFVTGPPVALVDNVLAHFLSNDGKLLYTTLGAGGNSRQLIWITRSGDVAPVDVSWSFDRGPSINQGWSVSPDGQRIAISEWSSAGYDIWIKELASGAHYPITFDEGNEQHPVWADPQTVSFLSDRRGDYDVWSVRADGVGDQRLEWDFDRGLLEATWSRDGRWLIGRTGIPVGGNGLGDVFAIRPGQDTLTIPLLTSPAYNETHPALSPNGRWLAYTSNESGRLGVSVSPFPEVASGRVRVAVAGQTPRWSRDGAELFYMDDNRNIVVIPVGTNGDLELGEPRVLFEIPENVDLDGGRKKFDVAPDGSRFLFARYGQAIETEDAPMPVLVHNFFEELRQRVPN